MGWEYAFEALGKPVLSRAELMAFGATGRLLTAAVRFDHLLRVRRDHYALPGTDPHLLEAVRVGGRLACLSALKTAGIYVDSHRFTHLHLKDEASRLRSPRNRFHRLTTGNRFGARLHWGDLLDASDGTETSVGLADALLQSLYCQAEWLSVATFDSALHQRLISEAEVAEIFGAAPARFQPIRRLLDARAESGPESILRMIVREAGWSYDLQVVFEGIGRVDMVVEGCVVVEADSRLAHDGWEKQVRDKRRDLELGRLGYATLRPVSEHIRSEPHLVRSSIAGLIAGRRS